MPKLCPFLHEAPSNCIPTAGSQTRGGATNRGLDIDPAYVDVAIDRWSGMTGGVPERVEGRPRGQRRKLPYETVLGQEVIIRENGRERRVTAAQAFLLQLTKLGLDGDSAAARAAIAAIGNNANVAVPYRSAEIVISFVSAGSVNTAVECLRIGSILDRYRETARMLLEPWIVEAALARLAGKQLTREEQEVVLRATRTAAKVRWPEWWVVMPGH